MKEFLEFRFDIIKVNFLSIFKLILISIISLCTSCRTVKKDWIAVCGDGVVRVIDMSESDSTHIKEVWRWDKDDLQTILPKGYDRYMRNLDECKFVDNNTKMLLTASGNGMMLLDIKTKDLLCYAHVPIGTLCRAIAKQPHCSCSIYAQDG